MDGKIQSAGGIGESKIFCAPEEERVPSGEDRILACHINGMSIRDMNLTPEVLAALDFYATDEGVLEKNSRPNVREASGVELGPDGWNKAQQQKRDDVKDRGMTTYQARDPFKEVADQYAKPGMRARFLQAKKTLAGGNRDYTVVKQPNGDPVMVRGMLLGHITEEMAIARYKYYHQRGKQDLKKLDDDYKKEGGPTAVSEQTG